MACVHERSVLRFTRAPRSAASADEDKDTACREEMGPGYRANSVWEAAAYWRSGFETLSREASWFVVRGRPRAHRAAYATSSLVRIILGGDEEPDAAPVACLRALE